MRMGPDPMDFGVSFGGANAIYTITDARSNAQLTARIADDTSQGRFRIARLTSYTVVREPGGDLPPGRRGVVTGLEENDTTDGSRPLQVNRGNTVDIDVSFLSGTAGGDRSTATLIIEDASPRPWPPISTHLVAHVGGVTTGLPNGAQVRQDESVSVPFTVVSDAGPDTVVDYHAAPDPGGLMVTPLEVPLPRGAQVNAVLEIAAPHDAPLGIHDLTLFTAAFDRLQTESLDLQVTVLDCRPVLSWFGPAPVRVTEGQAFGPVRVHTRCVPQDIAMVKWLLDGPDQTQIQIPSTMIQTVGATTPDDYDVTIPALPAVGDRMLASQTWNLVVQVPLRNNVQSAPLPFQVFPGQVVGAAAGYTLTLTPTSQTFQYGDQAAYAVDLTPRGNFAELVDLTTPGMPPLTGFHWDFFDGAVASRAIDAGSANRTRALRGPVNPRLFSPGSNVIAVSGVSNRTQMSAAARATLTVNRTLGEFKHVYPEPKVPGAADVVLDDPDTKVHIVYQNFGPNDFRVTFTRADLPGMPTTMAVPAVHYLTSPHNRIGVAIAGAGLAQTVRLFDLGFTGGPGWNIATVHQLQGNALRQQYWFSQDDSLLLVIRVIGETPQDRLPPGTQLGTIWTYGASLYDAPTATALGNEQQFAALNLLADLKEMDAQARNMRFNMNQDMSFQDPDPDPNQGAPSIADIYKVEMRRDAATGGLRVEGTYRLLNGILDGTSFDQEMGAHPNNFGKFVLLVR